MTDLRPTHCRTRLREEGKAYPRSSCTACHSNVLTGLKCPHGSMPTPAPAPLPIQTDTSRPNSHLTLTLQYKMAESDLRNAQSAFDEAKEAFLRSVLTLKLAQEELELVKKDMDRQ